MGRRSCGVSRGMTAGLLAGSLALVLPGLAQAAFEIRAEWRTPPPETALKSGPVGIASDRTIFVLDRRRAMVEHYDPDGALLREWPVIAGPPRPGGRESDAPIDLTVGGDGLVWVLDGRDGKAKGYSTNGDLVRQVGALIGDGGSIAVTASGIVHGVGGGSTIWRVGPDGQPLEPITVPARELGSIDTDDTSLFVASSPDSDFAESALLGLSMEGELRFHILRPHQADAPVMTDDAGNVYISGTTGHLRQYRANGLFVDEFSVPLRAPSHFDVMGRDLVVSDYRHSGEVFRFGGLAALRETDEDPPETEILGAPPRLTAPGYGEFALGSDEPATYLCQFDAAPPAACPADFEYRGLAVGPHTLRVAAVDPVGNVDLTPVSFDFLVASPFPPDTVLVEAPHDRSAPWDGEIVFASTEAGSRFECRFGDPGENLRENGWTACSSPFRYGKPVDAFRVDSFWRRLEVRAISASGNIDPTPIDFPFRVDVEDPGISNFFMTPERSGSRTSLTPTFTWTAGDRPPYEAPEPHVECSIDEGPFHTCSSPHEPVGLTGGPHRLTLRATDPAGNSYETSRGFVVDTDPPETSIGTTPREWEAQARPRVGVQSDEPALSFECFLDGQLEDLCDEPPSDRDHHIWDLPLLSHGPHRITATAVDEFGNRDPTPLERTFNVDLIRPQATITGVSRPDSEQVSRRRITFEADEPATFSCRLDSNSEAAFAPCESPLITPELGEGSHLFEVRAEDRAGNRSYPPSSTTIPITPTRPRRASTRVPPRVRTQPPTSSPSRRMNQVRLSRAAWMGQPTLPATAAPMAPTTCHTALIPSR
jgi:hypothetical protein